MISSGSAGWFQRFPQCEHLRESLRRFDAFKTKHRRPPTWDDVWDVLFAMGYRLDAKMLFGKAMNHYQTRRRRPFPTFSQVLAAADAMGYRLATPAGALPVA